MSKPRARTLQQRFGFMDDDLKTPKHDEIMLWLDMNIHEILTKTYWGTKWDKNWVNTCQKRATLAISNTLQLMEKEHAEALDKINELQIRAVQSNFSTWERDKLDKAKELVSAYPALSIRLKEWNGLGNPPTVPEIEIDIAWENPIKDKSYIIGFVDMSVEIDFPGLTIFGIEYKRIPSFQNGKETGFLIDMDIEPEWDIIREYKQSFLHFEVKSSIPSLGELIRQINMYKAYKSGRYVVVSPDDRFKESLKRQRISFLKYDPPNLTLIQ